MITDIISIVASVAAALFAFLALINQTRTSVFVEAELMCLNNGSYFEFDSQKESSICISNTGYKTITVTDVIMRVGKQRFSLNSIKSQNERINLLLNPGEVKYYPVEREFVIESISKQPFKDKSPIVWMIKTNNGKTFKAKTKNKVRDVVNCNEGK